MSSNKIWSELKSLQKNSMVARVVLDVGILITALVFAFRIDHHDKHGGSTTPYLFDIYHLRPYEGVGNISKFYLDSVADTYMCNDASTPDPAGCDPSGVELAAFTQDLQAHTGCYAWLNSRSPMCSECVDAYAARIHATVVGLDDFRIDSTDEDDTDLGENLRDELEACVARTGGARTAHYMFSTNPWTQFFLWAGFALTYSLLQLILVSTNKDEPVSLLVLVPVVVYGACVFFYIFFLFFPQGPGTAEYDLHFGVFQLICMGMAFLMLLRQSSSNPAKNEKHVTITFGVYMIAVAPSIGLITCAFHSWLEYDMINMAASLLLTFFAVCLVDDIFSVYWSKTTEKREADHIHLHAFLLTTLIFVVIITGTLNLPLAPKGDPMNGTVLFSILVIFMAIYASTPSILYEVIAGTPPPPAQTQEFLLLGVVCIFSCSGNLFMTCTHVHATPLGSNSQVSAETGPFPATGCRDRHPEDSHVQGTLRAHAADHILQRDGVPRLLRGVQVSWKANQMSGKVNVFNDTPLASTQWRTTRRARSGKSTRKS